METTYDERHPYDGREFAAVYRSLSPRELKRTLKVAYRTEGKKVKDMVAAKAAGSGLAHGAQVGRSVRVRVYPKGGGFMVTTKPHNGGRNSAGSTARGFHKNSRGQWKPIALWANGGTQSRYIGDHQGRRVMMGDKGNVRWRTIGPYRGSMSAYNFLTDAEGTAVSTVNRDLYGELTAAAQRQLEKRGIKTGG